MAGNNGAFFELNPKSPGLQPGNNLSDVENPTQARTNIGAVGGGSVVPDTDGFHITDGTVTPRTLVVTGANCTLNQNVSVGGSPIWATNTATLYTSPSANDVIIQSPNSQSVVVNLTSTANNFNVVDAGGGVVLQVLGNNAVSRIKMYGNTISAANAAALSSLSGSNTGDQTITLTGNVTGSGTGSFTTTIASCPASTLTGTTLPASIVTSSLTSVGTIGSGTWQGAVLAGQYGGTGVNNSGKSITLGGNLTTSGAFGTTFTMTGTTNVTFPTSGTLATTSGVVTSITGTANQVIASSSTGAVTLSLPQSIATTSTPQFAGLTITSTGDREPIATFSSTGDCSIRIDGAVAAAIGGESYLEFRNGLTTASNAWKIGLNDANRLDFNYGIAGSMNSSGQFMSILTSGYISVGNQTPEALFDVGTTGDVYARVSSRSYKSNGKFAGLDFCAGGDSIERNIPVARIAGYDAYAGGGYIGDLVMYSCRNSTGLTEGARLNNSGYFGINNSAPNHFLDVVGATNNNQVRLSNVTTNTTNKLAGIVITNYTTASTPVQMIYAQSTNTYHSVRIGGANASTYGATEVCIYTAVNTTTNSGTLRAFWESTGVMNQACDQDEHIRVGYGSSGSLKPYLSVYNNGSLVGYLQAFSTTSTLLASQGNLNLTAVGASQIVMATNGNARLTVDSDGALLYGISTKGTGAGYMMTIANVTTAPTTNPTGGGILYSQAGAGKWRGSSGTVTTFGPAEPHCPICDSDFGWEWENKKYGGILQVCASCLTNDIGEKPYIRWKKAA